MSARLLKQRRRACFVRREQGRLWWLARLQWYRALWAGCSLLFWVAVVVTATDDYDSKRHCPDSVDPLPYYLVHWTNHYVVASRCYLHPNLLKHYVVIMDWYKIKISRCILLTFFTNVPVGWASGTAVSYSISFVCIVARYRDGI